MQIEQARKAFLKGKTLRAAINLGNPILARAGKDGAAPTGISVDLAHEFASIVDEEHPPLINTSARN